METKELLASLDSTEKREKVVIQGSKDCLGQWARMELMAETDLTEDQEKMHSSMITQEDSFKEIEVLMHSGKEILNKNYVY